MAGLVALGVAFDEGTTESSDNTVIIYAALDTKTANDLAAAFKAKTGLDAQVALQIEQADTVASGIKSEAANPRADVVIRRLRSPSPKTGRASPCAPDMAPGVSP